MAKYVIEDTTLTGIADAIRAKTGGTDPIPVTDMAAQIAAITGGGSEALFPTQTLDGFAYSSTYGAYNRGISPAPFELTVGETYTVEWDGVFYICVAQDLSAAMTGAVGIGDASTLGGLGNDEPFLIAVAPNGSSFISKDTATSHTVAIYQKASGGTSTGGSVEGIVYVTFMNGDTELCKTACMKGDSTVDPVEDGKIAVPTKAPSVSTVYTYAGGWALTDGGEADVAALVDVSEDRAVYAVYAESVREYTINFYDDDGTTLLESLQVAYGQTPNPATPTKTGWFFDSWSPALAAVTGDANYQVVWTEAISFADSGWATISSVCETGNAADYFAVGDTRVVTSDDGNYTYTLHIVAINVDKRTSSSVGRGITVAVTPLDYTSRYSGTTSLSSYNYGNSAVKTWLNNSFPERLPSNLQAVVKDTYVKYVVSSTGAYSSLTAKYFVPSVEEINGTYPGLRSLAKSLNSESEFWLRDALPGDGYASVSYYRPSSGTVLTAGVNYTVSTTKYVFPIFCI